MSTNDPTKVANVLGMEVTISEGATLIGTAFLNTLDPPMCVATGTFQPTSAYDFKRHANVVDGDYIAEHGDILEVKALNGDRVKSEAISIQDWPTLGEREIHILGIYGPSFDELFGEHPDYRAYWGKD